MSDLPPPATELAAPSLFVVTRLGLAQTLAWASSYYLPALLAAPMAHDLGVGPSWVFGAFSLALVVSALVGPAAGRAIDRHGGRLVLAGTNLLFAAGLVLLACSTGPATLVMAWAVIGIAMGCGLYDAAFATLVRLHGPRARSAITGITLLAGFASTVGWPLTAWLETWFGWREACAAWALLHLLVGLPLNLSLPRPIRPREDRSPGAPHLTAQAKAAPRESAILLSVVFAITWFTSTAMATHLPVLLASLGLGTAAALGIAALIGPAQVAARLLEFSLLRSIPPFLSARLACLAHPVGAMCLLAVGAPLAPLFALLHGMGNGILTIAKGTLPLVVFGAGGYGARQGLLMAPARIAQAAAPFLYGLLLEQSVRLALGVCAVLGVLAWLCLRRVEAFTPAPQGALQPPR